LFGAKSLLISKITDIPKAIMLYWCFIAADALASFMRTCGEERPFIIKQPNK
jgi:hypothetical protein